MPGTSLVLGGIETEVVPGEGLVFADRTPCICTEQICAMEATERLAGGHRPKRAAMSPDTPPATTVGEPGIFAVVTHDRTVAWIQSHAQGRLP